MNFDNQHEEAVNLSLETAKENKFQERRKYVRIDYIFDIYYKVLPEITDYKEQGTAKNLSLGGVAFQIFSLETKVKLDSILVLKFSVKEIVGEISALGRVIRIWEEEHNGIKKKFCAVKFITIDPYDYEILNDFINQYIKTYQKH